NHEKVPSAISYSRTPGFDSDSISDSTSDDDLYDDGLEAHDIDEERVEQWGSDLSPEAVTIIHTKLRLNVEDKSEELDFILSTLEAAHRLNFDYIRNSAGITHYCQKSPEQIVTDYLKKVFGFLRNAV